MSKKSRSVVRDALIVTVLVVSALIIMAVAAEAVTYYTSRVNSVAGCIYNLPHGKVIDKWWDVQQGQLVVLCRWWR